MTRNTIHRVEVAAPIYDEAIRQRIQDMFDCMLRDNRQAREMQPDGSYVRVHSDAAPVNAQEYFYQQAYGEDEK